MICYANIELHLCLCKRQGPLSNYISNTTLKIVPTKILLGWFVLLFKNKYFPFLSLPSREYQSPVLSFMFLCCLCFCHYVLWLFPFLASCIDCTGQSQYARSMFVFLEGINKCILRGPMRAVLCRTCILIRT